MVTLIQSLLNYQILFFALSLSLSFIGATHALLRKRDPRSALGWMAICIGLPIAGALLYFLFGINRVSTRAIKLKKSRHTRSNLAEQTAEDHRTPQEYTQNNSVRAHYGQHRAYTAMLAQIAAARHSVLLSSYIFRLDEAGDEFVAALSDAAGRGVRVYVLIDGIGELYSLRKVARPLRTAGVEVMRYLPPKLLPPSFHINLRNHRKILVVDGCSAFTGGMNIGGKEHKHATDIHLAQDIQFQLEGPVVGDIANVFWDDWDFAARGRPLWEPPACAPAAGDEPCRVMIDGPDEHLDTLAMFLFSAVAGAQHSVTVMTPYFVPTRELIGALTATAMRGVRVRVILPRKSNLRFVDWATRKLLWELLQVGVEVYFLPPPFRHTKLLLVDDDYVMLGSANWDTRSLRLNFEIGVEVRSVALRNDLEAHCDHAVELARRTSLADMDGRNIFAKVRDAFAWLGSPYL